MDIQKLIDMMSDKDREIRSLKQMTLGKLIERLKELDQDMEMMALDSAHSYRGYYADLAFEEGSKQNKQKVSDVLKVVSSCLGETFEGYKGGDFIMDEDAPVWIARYGSCGTRIMDITDKGSIITAHEE